MSVLEPSITPVASATPVYYLDQIDVAVELPMGVPGEQGPPGTEWIITGEADPPVGTFDDGTLFLSTTGSIWKYTEGVGWGDTGVDLSPEIGAGVPIHDHVEYLRLSGGAMTGPLTGTDAAFTGNVVVPTPDAPTEAVNVEYLDTTITNLNLEKFLGDVAGDAISTGLPGWVNALGQAIYQNPNPVDVPPGVTGPTVGLTMRQSAGNITQLICDVTRNIWFTRTQAGGAAFGAWSTLTPIIKDTQPVDGPNAAPHGTIWIQTDSTVTR